MQAVCSGTRGRGWCGWSDITKPPEITAPTPLSTFRLTHSPTVSPHLRDSLRYNQLGNVLLVDVLIAAESITKSRRRRRVPPARATPFSIGAGAPRHSGNGAPS